MLIISNPNASPVSSVVITDWLPAGMSAPVALDVPFTTQSDGTLQWAVSLTVSQVLTTSFTVQLSTDAIYYNTTITNSANFAAIGFANPSFTQTDAVTNSLAGVTMLTPTVAPMPTPTPPPAATIVVNQLVTLITPAATCRCFQLRDWTACVRVLRIRISHSSARAATALL